jgi:hypothetical protein
MRIRANIRHPNSFQGTHAYAGDKIADAALPATSAGTKNTGRAIEMLPFLSLPIARAKARRRRARRSARRQILAVRHLHFEHHDGDNAITPSLNASSLPLVVAALFPTMSQPIDKS